LETAACGLEVEITEVESEKHDDYCSLTARVKMKRRSRVAQVYYHFPAHLADWLNVSADPFIAAFLPISMVLKEPLVVSAPGSKKLIEALPQIMKVYHSWNPRFQFIPVEVTQTEKRTSRSDKVALFFSGGLDSFYTLSKLTNQSPQNGIPTHLVFVHGFDIALQNMALFNKAFSAVKDVADNLNREMVVVSTNVRDISKSIVHWLLYYGAATVSIAHCLGGLFRTVYLASDQNPVNVYPQGFHPDLDPLWSSETTSFIHYGAEANRVQKTREIADWPLAQQHLRVCWENRAGAYNCCRCRKCVMTMIQLHMTGKLEKFMTFPLPLTTEAVRRVRPSRTMSYLESNLAELRKSGEEDLADALAHAMRIGRITIHFQRLFRRFVSTGRWLANGCYPANP